MDNVAWLFASYVFPPFLWLVSALNVVAIVAVLITVVLRRRRIYP